MDELSNTILMDEDFDLEDFLHTPTKINESGDQVSAPDNSPTHIYESMNVDIPISNIEYFDPSYFEEPALPEQVLGPLQMNPASSTPQYDGAFDPLLLDETRTAESVAPAQPSPTPFEKFGNDIEGQRELERVQEQMKIAAKRQRELQAMLKSREAERQRRVEDAKKAAEAQQATHQSAHLFKNDQEYQMFLQFKSSQQERNKKRKYFPDSEDEEKDRPNKKYILPKKDPKKRWIKVNAGTRGLTRRPYNIENVDLSGYMPLPPKPASWGSINFETGRPVFEYTKDWELVPELKLTPSQIADYIGTHPLHHRLPNGKLDGKRSGLRMYIQITPADSARRYPSELGSKCRCTHCPIKEGTIAKGMYRVCFDELSSGGVYDPYHNPFYLHLYCLERYHDFPSICKKVNVLPDDRELPEGRNKMAITRVSKTMKSIVNQFINKSKSWVGVADGKKPLGWYQHSLSMALTKEHIRCEHPQVKATRAQRAKEQRLSNHIEIHMNNLEDWAKNYEMMQVNKKIEAEERAKIPQKHNGELWGEQDEDSHDEDSCKTKKPRKGRSSKSVARDAAKQRMKEAKARASGSLKRSAPRNDESDDDSEWEESRKTKRSKY